MYLIHAASAQPPLQKIILFLQRYAQYSASRPSICLYPFPLTAPEAIIMWDLYLIHINFVP